MAREWWFALALGAAVVLWLSTLFTGDDSPGGPAITATDPPRYVVEGGTWQRMDSDGRPLYRVEAERIRVYANERVEVEAPRIEGLGEHEVWQLSAPRGDAPAFSRRLTLRGGVSLKGRWTDGAPLTGNTPVLVVDAEQRTLESDEAVTLEGPGRRIRGVGMRTDWQGEQLQLLSKVKVEYRDQ